MPIHVNKDDAERLAQNIERNGGDAGALRAALEETSERKTAARTGEEMSDQEYVDQLILQSPQETGKNLNCVLCKNPAELLISGCCRACFTNWALSTRKKHA